MSLNSLTVKKLLLAAGLLLVLGQGLWQLPALQDYLSPVDQGKSILQQARKECPRIKNDLRTLKARVDYLTWFQAHDGPDQKISADRLYAFPFSESIRSLVPGYFWQTNIRLAHKNRLRVERKLQYLQALLKNIDAEPPALPAKAAAVSGTMKQIQQFHQQYRQYNAQLIELTKQLTWLEDHGYKK